MIDVIQLLRGVAALLVVFFHIVYAFDYLYTAWGFFWFGGGEMGVPLFFVISGFIMVYISHETTLSPLGFLMKRVLRIIPLYRIALTFYGICRYHGALFLDETLLLSYIRSLFFIPIDFSAQAPFFGYNVLKVAWTLNYEMLFYILFAISLFFQKRRYYAFYAFFVILLLVLPQWGIDTSRWNVIVERGFNPGYLNLLTNPVMRNFLVGCLIGHIYLSKRAIRNRYILLTLIAMSSYVFGYMYFYHIGNMHITSWGGVSALLVLSLIMYHKAFPLHLPVYLTGLGTISYSLYVWHLIVLSIVLGIGKVFAIDWSVFGLWMYPLMLSLIIVVAILSYYFIECQLTRRLTKIFAPIWTVKSSQR